MPRRSRTAKRLALHWALACLWVGCLAYAAPASAELSGSVDGRALIGFDQRYGGAVMVDAWASFGMLRLGAATGLGAISNNDEASSRVLAPLALSLAIVPKRHDAGFFGVARVGAYGGAAKEGLIVGLFLSGGLGYAFALGEGASIRVGADLWGLIGMQDRDEGGLFVGPSLGLGF